ncbi:aldo/keto reductase [Leifsonia sp. NPDC077715]|uniref:aldo/keto reductase n=1 Tax=Leifsonia sp. NPDC077715 TaxID=3155539 RepID=UPI00342AB222
MKVRHVRGTDIVLTEVGFGSAVLGNLRTVVTDDDARRAVDAAWERGVRYFDTAPHYGLGLAEERLGRALAPYPRSEYVLSTKVGRLLVPNAHPQGRDAEGFDVPDERVRVWDFSRDGIHRSLQQSLERLRVDHIDIAFVHDPDQHHPESLAEAMETLNSLVAHGTIRAAGPGTNSSEATVEGFALGATTAMLAGRYTLIDPSAGVAALPEARRSGRSIIAAGVFNSGILATDFPDPTATFEYLPASADVRRRVAALVPLCASFGITVPAAAIAFPLTSPYVASVVLGMRNASEVERNLDLYEHGVDADFWPAWMAAGSHAG